MDYSYIIFFSFYYMYSQVEHYVCFYLIFFLYNIKDIPRKNVFFGVVPNKTVICVPGKVVYLHELIAFGFG